MNAIRAIVRNGRIETEEPIDLPEGTELLIPIPNGESDDDGGWDNSPEGIAAWLQWYDSLQPLIPSETEAEADAWMKQCEQYGLEKSAKKVEDLFP